MPKATPNAACFLLNLQNSMVRKRELKKLPLYKYYLSDQTTKGIE